VHVFEGLCKRMLKVAPLFSDLQHCLTFQQVIIILASFWESSCLFLSTVVR
jgi:hypothetical protein